MSKLFTTVTDFTGLVSKAERKQAFNMVFNGLAILLIGLIPMMFLNEAVAWFPGGLYAVSLLCVIVGLLFVVSGAVQFKDVQRRQDQWGSLDKGWT